MISSSKIKYPLLEQNRRKITAYRDSYKSGGSVITERLYIVVKQNFK